MSDDAPQKSRGLNIDFWLALPIAGIVILLLTIVVPNFIKARSTCAQAACINNLRQIDGAKDQWAIEKGHKVGETAVASEVVEYIKGGMPVCPDGGYYALHPIGENPTCSIGGARHSLP